MDSTHPARRDGIAGGLRIVGDDQLDARDGQFLRLGNIGECPCPSAGDEGLAGTGMAVGATGRAPPGWNTGCDASDVPELHDDAPACFMDACVTRAQPAIWAAS
jgi:hypothetical protein